MNLLRLYNKLTFRYSEDSKYILSLKGKYKGRRCFVIGNGPSLTVRDLNIIKDELSFASNRIHKLFDKTSWRPTFYTAIDAEVVGEDVNIIRNLDLPCIFLEKISAGKFKLEKKNNIYYINLYAKFRLSRNTIRDIQFSENVEKYFGSGYTVTYTALQFAIYMGFTEIYLLGIDHSYNRVIDSKGKITSTDTETSHFYKDEKQNVIGYQYLEGTNYAYQMAKDYADAHGVKIYNATRGGKLEIFERVNFDSLFKI